MTKVPFHGFLGEQNRENGANGQSDESLPGGGRQAQDRGWPGKWNPPCFKSVTSRL
jgi:hypothetical protein